MLATAAEWSSILPPRSPRLQGHDLREDVHLSSLASTVLVNALTGAVQEPLVLDFLAKLKDAEELPPDQMQRLKDYFARGAFASAVMDMSVTGVATVVVQRVLEGLAHPTAVPSTLAGQLLIHGQCRAWQGWSSRARPALTLLPVSSHRPAPRG